MIRGRGPRPVRDISTLSRNAQYERRRKRNATRTIIAGAGPGRVGSTALACHLQREGFKVTHEAGNKMSADFDPHAAAPDTFNLYEKTQEQRLAVAKSRVEEWLDKGRGAVVAGDVGLSNSQIMHELLLADPRVMLVVQVRDPAQYAKSWLAINGNKQALWETILLQSRGITAARFPQKEARVKQYMRDLIAEAYRLQCKFGLSRVRIVDVKDLATEGPKLLRELGATNTTWDMRLGRNGRSARLHRRKGREATRSVVAEASGVVHKRPATRAVAKRPASRGAAKRPASRAAAKRPASRVAKKRPASRAELRGRGSFGAGCKEKRVYEGTPVTRKALYKRAWTQALNVFLAHGHGQEHAREAARKEAKKAAAKWDEMPKRPAPWSRARG